MYGILSACYYWEVTVTCHYKNEGKVEHMDWKIDESVREKVLKFKADYEQLFQEMAGPMKSWRERSLNICSKKSYGKTRRQS